MLWWCALFRCERRIFVNFNVVDILAFVYGEWTCLLSLDM